MNNNIVPPHNFEVEESVLGAMLISKLAIIEAIDIISKDSFYSERNSLIFQGIVICFNKNIEADIITIPNELRILDKNKVVDIMYISNIMLKTPTAANIKEHCRILQEYYIKRIVLANAYDTINQIRTNKVDALEILQKQQSQYENVVDKITYQITTPQTQSDLLISGYHKATSGLIKTYNCGLNIIDRNIRFIRPNKSIVIGARTSIGKTALGLTLQRNLSLQGAITGYLTSEMTAYELLLRHTSMETGINSELLDTGIKNHYAEIAIKKYSGLVKDRNMYFEEFSKLNEIGLKAKISRMVKLFGIEVVFIDYINQIVGSNLKATREEQIAEISRTIKACAMEFGIPIITMVQINREAEKTKNRTPQIHQARGSGAIEQDADVFIAIDRPEQNGITTFENGESCIGKANLIFGKNRGGKIGIMTVNFTKETTLFWENSESPQYSEYENEPAPISWENPYINHNDEPF